MSDLINAQIHISNSQSLKHRFVMSEAQVNSISLLTTKLPQCPCHAGCFGVMLKCLFVTLGSRFWIRQTQILWKMLEPFILFLITALVLPTCPRCSFSTFQKVCHIFPSLLLPVSVALPCSIYISKH